MPWEQDRREELSELVSMLHKLRCIDRGSNFIGKLQYCIDIAEKLTSSRIDITRKDFCSFLLEQATKEE